MKKTIAIVLVLFLASCTKDQICSKKSTIVIDNLLYVNYMVRINGTILGDQINENNTLELNAGTYVIETLTLDKRVFKRDTIELKKCETIRYFI